MRYHICQIDGRLLVAEQPEEDLWYLLPIKWWNPCHIAAFVRYLSSKPEPFHSTPPETPMTIYPPEMNPILDKIDPTFGRVIDCDEGWWGIVKEMHQEIMAIDPEYRVYQIKEKFGALRFYYEPSRESCKGEIDSVISHYEHLSTKTCEITGGPGEIMSRNGVYKTLSRSFIDEGWEPVSPKE